MFVDRFPRHGSSLRDSVDRIRRRTTLSRVTCFATGVAVMMLPLLCQANEDRPVAWVDEHPIWESDVEGEVEKITASRRIEGAALDVLRAQALEQLISQVLILGYLEEQEMAASQTDCQLEIERIEEQLQRTARTLADFLKENELTEDRLRHRIRWRLSWSRYIDRFLTDENLQQFFEDRKMEYDGTKLHAWQIFVRLDDSSNESARNDAVAKAEQWIESLNQSESEFEELAREVSDSPSGENGGDLGWVDREGDLPESVLAELFRLEPGELSHPIVSRFGVHLVKWTDAQPGQKSWEQAGARLEKDATQFLFDWAADQRRDEAVIRFDEQYPHFEPGTRRLAGQ